jgi:2-oxoacid:acceptor oxidoreductase delta subunit (pyruvate/2-ketoisovalerate family)
MKNDPCEIKAKLKTDKQPSACSRRTEPLMEEGAARREASRCFINTECRSCDLCRFFCPDLCITRNAGTGLIQIDYVFCKGCGICAFICPKKAIRMERDEG